jgi:hypothetical protein
MSTSRRMFEDPRNTYIVRNDDPAAFDKRFVNRPGVHREQQCCRNCAPVWQTYLTHDDEDPSDDNRSAYKEMVGLQVQDATGESDNVTGRNETKGMVWVEGLASGYKPAFISPEEWMRWQGVYWMPSPTPVPGMPNPPRWVRIPGERKMRWGDEGQWEFLWCKKCETPLEAIWSDVLAALPIAARGIAMVASYVPVFGTALSLAINTTVSLAEGQPIDQSLLDGIGGALPEQPASGMAFNAAVAIGRGERLDHVALDTFPLDESVKDVLKVADEVVFGIASGQAVTDVMYNTIHDRLPPEAQQGMDYARRVINGENIPQMILTQAEQVVADGLRNDTQSILEEAKGQGAAAMSAAQSKVGALYNQYAAEFGYQMALDMLPPEATGWLQLGLVGGAALRERPQIEERFATVPESNVAENDNYKTKGENLIASGIKYNIRPVSDILEGSKFNIVIDSYDLLDEVWTKRLMSYDITDAWRRGFTIAIGVCEGSSERGPGQLAVYHTLAEVGGRAGFEAGQAVQFNRTLSGDSGLFKSAIAKADQPSDAALLAKKEDVAVSAITNVQRR